MNDPASLEEIIRLIESQLPRWTWLLRRDGHNYFANIYETKPVYGEDDVYFRGRGASPREALLDAYHRLCTIGKSIVAKND